MRSLISASNWNLILTNPLYLDPLLITGSVTVTQNNLTFITEPAVSFILEFCSNLFIKIKFYNSCHSCYQNNLNSVIDMALNFTVKFCNNCFIKD